MDSIADIKIQRHGRAAEQQSSSTAVNILIWVLLIYFRHWVVDALDFCLHRLREHYLSSKDVKSDHRQMVVALLKSFFGISLPSLGEGQYDAPKAQSSGTKPVPLPTKSPVPEGRISTGPSLFPNTKIPPKGPLNQQNPNEKIPIFLPSTLTRRSIRVPHRPSRKAQKSKTVKFVTLPPLSQPALKKSIFPTSSISFNSDSPDEDLIECYHNFNRTNKTSQFGLSFTGNTISNGTNNTSFPITTFENSVRDRIDHLEFSTPAAPASLVSYPELSHYILAAESSHAIEPNRNPNPETPPCSDPLVGPTLCDNNSSEPWIEDCDDETEALLLDATSKTELGLKWGDDWESKKGKGKGGAGEGGQSSG